MEKKFELTGESRIYNGRTLFRIRALKDFYNMRAGELGGWLERESNLSQDGTAWVTESAMVMDRAHVQDGAVVQSDSILSGKVNVFGKAIITSGVIKDEAKVGGYASVSRAEIAENAVVIDDAAIYPNAKIGGNARIEGKAQIGGDAVIKSTSDYFCVYPIGNLEMPSDCLVFTAFKSSDGVQCAHDGTLAEFTDFFDNKVTKRFDYPESQQVWEVLRKLVESKLL